MKISKQPDGSFVLDISGEELEWFGQTLNECCNGFGVKDFQRTIGTDRAVLQGMLTQIGKMYAAPIGHEG